MNKNPSASTLAINYAPGAKSQSSIGALCPLKGFPLSSFLVKSQRIILLSLAQEIIWVPSMSMAKISSLCPLNSVNLES